MSPIPNNLTNVKLPYFPNWGYLTVTHINSVDLKCPSTMKETEGQIHDPEFLVRPVRAVT